MRLVCVPPDLLWSVHMVAVGSRAGSTIRRPQRNAEGGGEPRSGTRARSGLEDPVAVESRNRGAADDLCGLDSWLFFALR